MRDSELSRDYTRSDAVVGHLHYLVSDVIGQGPPVDEHTAELVDPTLAQRGGHCTATNNRTLRKTRNSNALLQRFNRIPAGQPKAQTKPVFDLDKAVICADGTRFTRMIILDMFKPVGPTGSQATASNFTFKRH